MTDNGLMRLFILPVLSLSLTACVNVVNAPEEDASSAASGRGYLTDTGAPPPADETEPADPSDPSEPTEPTDPTDPTDPSEPDPSADPSEPPPGTDPDGDGVVPAGDPGPPPSEANQSCAEWTDCGPHYANENSGFDCVDNTCTCDDTGQWAQACADIGGSWSSWECFCFTNTETAMPAAAPEPPSEADDDVRCWWSWRHRYCDPDEWVDTSYYERVCYGDDCYNEYVEDGYYVDGTCYGRWIKRCTDGNEYWY